MKDEIELVVGIRVVSRRNSKIFAEVVSLNPFEYKWENGTVGAHSKQEFTEYAQKSIDNGHLRIEYPKSYYIKKFFNEGH